MGYPLAPSPSIPNSTLAEAFLCATKSKRRDCFQQSRRSNLNHEITMNEAEYLVASPRNSVKFSKQDKNRFWAKVDRDGPVIYEELGQCWAWTAFKSKHGYGRFWIQETMLRAHRASWILHQGFIPGDLWVLHHCDNPSCVNPTHLFLGDHQDNMDDKCSKGRQPKGANHPGTLHPERMPRGEQHVAAILTEQKVLQIREMFQKGIRSTGIAAALSFSDALIRSVVYGRTWKHVGGPIFSPPGKARGDNNWTRKYPEKVLRGEQQGRAKLTEKQVLEIRSAFAAGQKTKRDLARQFDVSPTLIRFVVSRKLWRHLP